MSGKKLREEKVARAEEIDNEISSLQSEKMECKREIVGSIDEDVNSNKETIASLQTENNELNGLRAKYAGIKASGLWDKIKNTFKG